MRSVEPSHPKNRGKLLLAPQNQYDTPNLNDKLKVKYLENIATPRLNL